METFKTFAELRLSSSLKISGEMQILEKKKDNQFDTKCP